MIFMIFRPAGSPASNIASIAYLKRLRDFWYQGAQKMLEAKGANWPYFNVELWRHGCL